MLPLIGCVSEPSSFRHSNKVTALLPSASKNAKSFLDSSHHYEDATKHFSEHGIEIEGSITLNFKQMIDRKAAVVEQTTKGIDYLMQKNKIDYWSALCFVKSKIDSEEWVVMSKGIDEGLSQDAQKGYSTLGQFNFSE